MKCGAGLSLTCNRCATLLPAVAGFCFACGQPVTPAASPWLTPDAYNSGEVVVRSIGSDLHMDYTAVGQPTHLSARMLYREMDMRFWLERAEAERAELR